MKKALVAYFSASGATARLAERLADAIGADLSEIEPQARYNSADLDWRNKRSRSSVEMNDRSCRPEINRTVDDMAQYDVVFVGFPIWWYREPSVIDTFMEAYDFGGKTVVPFATSGARAWATALPICRRWPPARRLRREDALMRTRPQINWPTGQNSGCKGGHHDGKETNCRKG